MTYRIKKNAITFDVEPCQIVKKNDDWFGGSEKFWQLLSTNNWEPETFAIFDKYLSKDYTYLDIGSWVGPTVLYGAQLSKECCAFEADPVAYNLLLQNIKVNIPTISNIRAWNVAIADHTGTISFGTNTNKGDSMSSILWTKESWIVDCVSLEDTFTKYNIQDCNFIKMDIEGGESSVLPSAKNVINILKPTIYLSLHIPWFSDKKLFLDKIVDTISCYKNVYTSSGQKIKHTDILNMTSFTSILITNKE